MSRQLRRAVIIFGRAKKRADGTLETLEGCRFSRGAPRDASRIWMRGGRRCQGLATWRETPSHPVVWEREPPPPPVKTRGNVITSHYVTLRLLPSSRRRPIVILLSSLHNNEFETNRISANHNVYSTNYKYSIPKSCSALPFQPKLPHREA